LDPEIKIGWWTVEEEKTLFESQKLHGNCWSKIATFLPGRTENAIKNYFYSTIRRNLRRYNRKVPESQRINGSISELIQKPDVVSLLMIPSDRKKAKPEVEQNLRKSSRLQAIKEVKPEGKEVKSADDEGSSILYSLYEIQKENPSPLPPPQIKPKSKPKPEITISNSMPIPQQEISETTSIFESPLMNNFYMAQQNNIPKPAEEIPSVFNWDLFLNPMPAESLISHQDSLQSYNRSDSIQSYIRCDSTQSYLRSDSSTGFLKQDSGVMRQDSLNDQPLFDLKEFLFPHYTPKDTFQHCSENR